MAKSMAERFTSEDRDPLKGHFNKVHDMVKADGLMVVVKLRHITSMAVLEWPCFVVCHKASNVEVQVLWGLHKSPLSMMVASSHTGWMYAFMRDIANRHLPPLIEF